MNDLQDKAQRVVANLGYGGKHDLNSQQMDAEDIVAAILDVFGEDARVPNALAASVLVTEFEMATNTTAEQMTALLEAKVANLRQSLAAAVSHRTGLFL